jgi:hypothetical protein
MPTVKTIALIPQGGGFLSLPPVASGVYSSGENFPPNNTVDVYPASAVDAALAQRDQLINGLQKRLLELETRLAR